jgi:hypothetical protein
VSTRSPGRRPSAANRRAGPWWISCSPACSSTRSSPEVRRGLGPLPDRAVGPAFERSTDADCQGGQAIWRPASAPGARFPNRSRLRPDAARTAGGEPSLHLAGGSPNRRRVAVNPQVA